MKLLRFLLLLTLTLTAVTSRAAPGPLALPANLKPEDRICFALYTVHERTLKLTAQFYPINNHEPFRAELQIWQNGKWMKRADAEINYPGYTATFRIDDWNDTLEQRYRVAHNNRAFYEGIVRKNPVQHDEFVMAALTCNSIYPQHGGDITRQDIVANLTKIKPDLLFFSGDQVYDHSDHYRYWLKFGRDFGELLRNTPTICIPDDHDVGQANLWGAGGKAAEDRRGINGGYYMPVAYVQEVERAQTSHLPDPFDPTPIERGIGVYYTDLTWGGISFAILEDRKFKSGPGAFVTVDGEPADALFDPSIDTRQYDHPDATLLGERQLRFLEHWTTDWKGAEMKTVLSQTIFIQANNYTGKHDREIIADFDSNGWPQAGRNRALAAIRKSFSCMVAGDQHLGSVVQHGVQEWGDAGYSFCTPAIANYWMRWWDPKEPGRNREENSPAYTGEFLDNFHNKMTVKAVANPSAEEIEEGGALSTRVAGFGIVRYKKSARTITFECWPRNVDITASDARQYPGWPITIRQEDNFNLTNGYQLPALDISKPDQVVTVLDSATGEVVSSLRIKGRAYQPKVRQNGVYHIVVGEGDDTQWFREIPAAEHANEKLKVIL